MPKSHQILIFDLDDTLIPTTEVLVPQTIISLVAYLKSEGLVTNQQEMLNFKKQYKGQKNETAFFTDFVSFILERESLNNNEMQLTTEKKQAEVTQNCFKLFHNPTIAADFAPFKDTHPVLSYLKTKGYELILLTQGNPESQFNKIKQVKILPYFDSIHIVDIFKKQKKMDFLKQILHLSKALPQHLLCIGDSLHNELWASHKLGIKTCWVLNNSDHSKVLREFDPDFTIEGLHDLVKTCRL